MKYSTINEGSEILILASDITQIKEQEMQAYNSRSLFFSQVAHELRTPLNTITPMSKRLDKYVKGEKGKQLIKIIENCSIHLSNIIEDALDMSRLENN